MDRTEILEKAQDFNDNVGSRFNKCIGESKNNYEMGAIHHQDYIEQVEQAVAIAKKELIQIIITE